MTAPTDARAHNLINQIEQLLMQKDYKSAELVLSRALMRGTCVNAHMGGERCVGTCMNPKDCSDVPLPDYDLKCTNGHDRCYMGTSDDCPYCERVPTPTECRWEYDTEEETWITSCGNAFVFNDGTPKENNVRFCCYCGKPRTGD